MTKSIRQIQPVYIRFKDIIQWQIERLLHNYPHPPKNGYQQFIKQWWQQAVFCDATDAVWWLGHATALICINQKWIITDPVFSQRASPFTWIGPKRRTPPGATIQQLPDIDMIIISHNHFDHLDISSIRLLLSRFQDIICCVPCGLKNFFQQQGAKNIIELDWWQSQEVCDIQFTCVPAKHWSKRSFWDKNCTLWCGWMIQAAEKCIYFAGDTGYDKQLIDIRNRFPPADIALLPIGAYSPRWFMHSQHMDPQQAIQLFSDLQCKQAIAIHWGTFELTDEPIDEPPLLLQQLCEEIALPSRFRIIPIGQHIKF